MKEGAQHGQSKCFVRQIADGHNDPYQPVAKQTVASLTAPRLMQASLDLRQRRCAGEA